MTATVKLFRDGADLVAKTIVNAGAVEFLPEGLAEWDDRGRVGPDSYGSLTGFGVNTRLPGGDLVRLAALADWLMEHGVEVVGLPRSLAA